MAYKEAAQSRTRPLGAVRKSLSGIESVPKFPPLRQAVDQNNVGLSAMGNAMQVPPRRSSYQHDSDSRTTTSVSFHSLASPGRRKVIHSSKSSDSAVTSARSDDKAKELREARSREEKLKQQVAQLQKIINELQKEITGKDKHIQDLHNQIAEQEQKYKELYENELRLHEETRIELETVRVELDTAKSTITDMQQKHVQEIKELTSLMEDRLEKLGKEKDHEIALRDEKLTKLKKQMADALKGNSWERQQQLEELTKELTRVQDEADNLRLKLKLIEKSRKNSNDCSNCEVLQNQLASSQKHMKEKENTIKDLKELCAKHEKQISQQELMLRKFAEQNIHKVPVIPK
ncbi:hypothetical protein LSH36_15g05012 [Paralvinella palmiformis]|uniref:Uncharacterized protein n=1 Tax=Paralvinella palmiformis TaxID=53620 RepID=A0AAD9KBI3_9ANNE|nr:hypothetical protein LSH36_15g05012 [Paralvinella palmiformis]